MQKLGPNFIIPGAGRSGTTTLCNYLKQHPDIYMLWYKEPNYFTLYFDIGTTWYLDLFYNNYSGKNLYKLLIKRLRSSLFVSCKYQKAIGEASTYYLAHPKVPKRLYEFNPEFKLIFILRNPINRAYSNYLRDLQMRGLKESFKGVIEKKQSFLQYGGYLYYGKYYKHITRYLEYFPLKQMHFIFFEDFIRNTDEELKATLEFLEINSHFIFNHGIIKKNPSKLPTSFTLQRFISKQLRPDWKSSYPRQALTFLLREALNYLNHRIQLNQSPKMKDSTRRSLLHYYEEDILNLEKLLKKDLSHWRLENLMRFD